jgi:hypothetical protein
MLLQEKHTIEDICIQLIHNISQEYCLQGKQSKHSQTTLRTEAYSDCDVCGAVGGMAQLGVLFMGRERVQSSC